MRVDVAILGAGAAGLFCAGEAARRGRSVVVIEHRDTPGEKIRISGGGRCNFTNLNTGGDRFLSENPKFALSALRRFTAQDFVARVRAAGIAFHEKAQGQLFCDGPATQITAMLVQALSGAELWTGTSFGAIAKTEQGFAVETSRGVVSAARLVVATGGKSVPKVGATPAGYRLAEQFGLRVTETRPALVPLTFGPQDLGWLAPLAGIAVPGRVGVGRASFAEPILFTHRGLSGPAILQASSYWREGQPVRVNLAEGQDVLAQMLAAKGQGGRIGLARALAGAVPERLAQALVARSGLAAPLAETAQADLRRLAAGVQALELKPVGTEGYRTAEVTLGGVDTAALDARTLEARAVPGLHFIGEVVDVTGWLGGYNFQWAWSSAWACAQAV
jgi:hypothetical protein